MASLESLWKESRDGALSPLEQMRAWALRTAQSDLGGDKAVNYKKIAERVTKVVGGHPTREAIRQLYSSGLTRTRIGIREITTGSAPARRRCSKGRKEGRSPSLQ